MIAAGLAVAQPEKKRPEGRGRGQESSAPAQDFPKSMPVPADMAAKGTVYYAISGKERQISLHSDAPVEQIDGYSSNVVGYAIAGPADSPAKLVGGEWRLPVASIDTGNRMRNKHLTEETWLDAAKYENIIFKLTEVKDVAPAKDPKEGMQAFTATLVGEMTMHGVTKPMTIPNATIAFRKGDETTKKTVDGDLLLIDCKYSVKLSDFGVKNKVVGQKVAEDIELTTKLVHSTVEPKAAKSTDKKEEKDEKKSTVTPPAGS
jgi:polyisoprenoid-binding protein YceI